MKILRGKRLQIGSVMARPKPLVSPRKVRLAYGQQRYRDEPAVPKREPRISSAPPDWTIEGGGSSLGGLW